MLSTTFDLIFEEPEPGGSYIMQRLFLECIASDSSIANGYARWYDAEILSLISSLIYLSASQEITSSTTMHSVGSSGSTPASVPDQNISGSGRLLPRPPIRSTLFTNSSLSARLGDEFVVPPSWDNERYVYYYSLRT